MLNVSGVDLGAVDGFAAEMGWTMRFRNGRRWLCVAVVLLAQSGMRGQQSFSNPIIGRGADPSVIQVDGFYYSVQSGCLHRGSTPVICIRKSATLQGLGAVAAVPVWTAPKAGPNAHDVWAPEIAHFEGKWYIYYAADPDANPHHTLFALTPEDEAHPLGAWREADTGVPGGGFPLDWKSAWAIDPSVFKASDGRYYMVFACRQDNSDTRAGNAQSICIAAMSDPLHLQANPVTGKNVVELSLPTRSWETRGFPTEEGPFGFTRNGVDYILYSASFSGTPDQYAEGLLVNRHPPQPGGRGNALLNPAAWVKEGPVFDGHHASYGTASGVFVPSNDGTQWWHVYHGTDCLRGCAMVDGKTWQDRSVRAQQAGWTAAGELVLGYPADIANTDGSGKRVALPAPSTDGSGSAMVPAWGAAFGDAAEGDAAAGAAVGTWDGKDPSAVSNATINASGMDRIFSASNPNLQQYVVYTKVRMIEAGPAGTPVRFGVYAAYVDQRNFVLATIDRECGSGPCVATEAVVAGKRAERKTCALPPGFRAGSDNTLVVEVVDGSFRVLVNDVALSGGCQQRKFALDEGQVPENGSNGQVGVVAQNAKVQFAPFVVSPGVPVDTGRYGLLFSFRNFESSLQLESSPHGDAVVEAAAAAPYPLTASPAQLWKLKQEPDGFTIANALSGMCLQGEVVARCNGSAGQRWELLASGDPSGFVLRNRASGLVLGHGGAGGAQAVSLAAGNGSAAQEWQLIIP